MMTYEWYFILVYQSLLLLHLENLPFGVGVRPPSKGICERMW